MSRGKAGVRKEEKQIVVWLGKYHILSMLGENGSVTSGGGGSDGPKEDRGAVFLAEHIRLGGRRAVKRIRKGHPFYRQLAGEARILGRLSHPAIPVLYDVEEDEDYLYLIEEYVEGISLKNLVLSEHLTEHQMIHIALQICEIIQYLHERQPPIYYLDLKPENLILTGGMVKLVDFGSAVFAAEAGEKASGSLLCLSTEGFAAPELLGGGTPGVWSDVYGIGCILYFMLTGDCFRNGMRLPKEKRTGAGGLWKLVKNCLQASVRRRADPEKLKATLLSLEQAGGDKNKKTRKASQGKQVIGVIGTHPGAGATYISLLLVSYLAGRTGKRVAYVEYNRHGDCVRIQQAGSGTPSVYGRRTGHVVFLPDVGAGELVRCLNDAYDYYVIDFGWELEECREEYLRCTEKLVVTQLVDWKLDDWKRFRTQIKGIFRQESWHYLFNLSPEEARGKAEVQGDCIPWEKSVKEPSAQTGRIFERLLL